MKKLFLILLLSACSNVSITPDIIGTWESNSWYCNNSKYCGTYYSDSVNEFSILENNNGILKLNQDADYAIYHDNHIEIRWLNQYTFTGVLNDNKIIGIILHIKNDSAYVWNNNITLIKR